VSVTEGLPPVQGGSGLEHPQRSQALGVPPAYVLGGYEAGLSVIRSLGAAGVPVVAVWHSEAEHARHSRHVKRRVRAPHPEHESSKYVDLLLDLGGGTGSGLLVPTTDETVTAVACAREVLDSRHAVACPPWAVAERFLDKHLTYEFADRLGIAMPWTVLPRSAADLERLAVELPYPFLLKPRSSHLHREVFGAKMSLVHDPAELISMWERAERAGVDTLVQEFIPGSESEGVNYNAYLVDGEPVVEVTARKVRLSPPDIGYPTVVVSGQVPEVIVPGRRLLKGLGLSGFANVEFKRDVRDGSYRLMEVNGRPNMSGLLSVRCGADFPLMTYRHLVFGEPPSRRSSRQFDEGVYWINETADLGAAASHIRAGRSSLRRHVEPYVRPHVFAEMSLTDPAPFGARALTKLCSALARAVPDVRREPKPRSRASEDNRPNRSGLSRHDENG
jgi:D-aspartate ligase